MTEKQYPYDNPLARLLREARAESGWTQVEAAHHMQLSTSVLGKLETGLQVIRKQITLDRIADTYNLARNDVLQAALASKARTPANPDQPIVTPTTRRSENPFADRIYQWRTYRKITRRQAAARIGISVSYLSGLENGTQSTRNREIVERMAFIYGIEFSDLWDLAPRKNVETVRKRERLSTLAPKRKLTDEEWAERNRIPPDMLDWLRGDLDHIQQVRKLMRGNATTSYDENRRIT